jgi:hypothetical protein
MRKNCLFVQFLFAATCVLIAIKEIRQKVILTIFSKLYSNAEVLNKDFLLALAFASL